MSKSKLIIYISPKELHIPFEQQRNFKTPKQRQNRTRRVITLDKSVTETDFNKMAREICSDAGDIYYGHEFA